MMPAGPLMIEHRLIERLITLMSRELKRMNREKSADTGFIDTAVDFIRTYADRCHHGKEEDILFRDLGKKPLTDEHKKTLHELIDEHVYARKIVKKLLEAKEAYSQDKKEENLQAIASCIKSLVGFYPVHIEKEDRRFFIPCMDYFSREEQDRMLEEFREFDRELIHEKYRTLIEKIEKQKG